ncbi:MAG: cell division protein FtsA [Rickettsiales bacterium]|nr:cell division protein FtsA [Rickettsiales bacterium]
MAKKSSKGKIVACLDLGSSKLVCIIAAINGEKIEVLGFGHKEALGINSSTISDMSLAQKSITNVVSQAERMAGFNIDKLLVGISGIQSTSHTIEVDNKISSDIVKNTDIVNLTNNVRSQFKKNNREIIHLIPLEYRIDDSSAVVNPRYMSGDVLYAKFHVVSTSQTTIKNIENCLKRCQLSVNNYIVEPYASALSCLSSHDMNLGSLVIEMGASSTSMAIILDGRFTKVASLPIGGIHITKDISTILNVSTDLAEKIKNLNGSLIISPIEEKEMIKMKLSAASEVSENSEIIGITRIQLRDIIQSRLEEIFESAKKILIKSGIPTYIIGNIILTGGVTAIVGLDKLATEIFDKNVRIGYPNKVDTIPSEILGPLNSCSIGMLVFLKKMYAKEKSKVGFESKPSFMTKLIDKLAGI